MAAAEFRAVFQAHGTPFLALRETPRFLDGHAEVFIDEVSPLLQRLGLTHVAAMHLFDGVPGSWTEGARDCCFPTGIPFAVRSVRIDVDAPWPGPEMEREVGAVLAPGRKVDLKHPKILARAFLLSDRVYVGQQLWESDPKALQERHVDNRPFSSPVSLEPRLARALVNLAVVRPGQSVLDPFCGTGGVLIEAAHMGLDAWGSDLDPAMVAGARENLSHFGLQGDVVVADVADATAELGVEEVDAIVSDLPYGRSSSSGKESLRPLYRRAFETAARVLRPGGYAVMGLPDGESARDVPSGVEVTDVFLVRSHKSLTRHFVRLRKRSA